MIFLYCLVVYFVILYIVTTVRLFRSDSYSMIQKIIQFCIIWFIPAIGVIVVALFLNQEPIKLKKSSFLKKLFLSLFFVEIEKRSISDYPDSNGNYIDNGYIGDYNIYDNCSFGGCDGGGD